MILDYPLCPLFQHLFYLQTIPNVVPEFCHYMTPNVFKMTWTWCPTGVPIAGSHLTPPINACLLRFYNRTVSPVNATYHLGQSEIPLLDHCKDLGIIFSTGLSWSQHYNNISAKAYKQLRLIRRTFSSSVSVRAKKLLYLSLVRSQLTYCCQIWRPHLIKDIIFIEKIQRLATKFILNGFSSDYRTRLIFTNCLTFDFLLNVSSFPIPVLSSKND